MQQSTYYGITPKQDVVMQRWIGCRWRGSKGEGWVGDGGKSRDRNLYAAHSLLLSALSPHRLQYSQTRCPVQLTTIYTCKYLCIIHHFGVVVFKLEILWSKVLFLWTGVSELKPTWYLSIGQSSVAFPLDPVLQADVCKGTLVSEKSCAHRKPCSLINSAFFSFWMLRGYLQQNWSGRWWCQWCWWWWCWGSSIKRVGEPVMLSPCMGLHTWHHATSYSSAIVQYICTHLPPNTTV